MRNCVRVALQSLNLPVKVRILVPQPKTAERTLSSRRFSLYSRIRNELRTPQGGVREQPSGGRLRQARGESARRKLCDFRRGSRFDVVRKMMRELRTPQGGVREQPSERRRAGGYAKKELLTTVRSSFCVLLRCQTKKSGWRCTYECKGYPSYSQRRRG